ncbi:MAG TPA: hypothetical protein VN743_02255 [Blastocatellia bacterium]|nr:hypothetical protein [Blastocatellia bacterium]
MIAILLILFSFMPGPDKCPVCQRLKLESAVTVGRTFCVDDCKVCSTGYRCDRRHYWVETVIAGREPIVTEIVLP